MREELFKYISSYALKEGRKRKKNYALKKKITSALRRVGT